MSDKPRLHGRDHRPGGSDPIADILTTDDVGIQFDTDPQSGGFLEIEATGDNGGVGIHLAATTASLEAEAVYVEFTATTSSMQFFAPDFLFTSISDGVNPASSRDFIANVGGSVLLNADGGANGLALMPGGDATLINNSGKITFYATPDFAVRGIVPGFGLQDILRVTHDPAGVAAPTFHIRTGAVWVADL